MTWKKTITYWALAGVLFGFYWFVDRKPAEQTIGEVRRERFLNVFRDEVVAVELVRDGKTVRTEKNKEKRWAMVEPTGIQVASDLITALVDNLTEYQDAEIVRKNPKEADLQEYGLDKPNSEVRVFLSDGEMTSFVFGSTNPPRTAVYARSSRGPQIYLVGLNLQYYADLLYSSAYH